jgi:uncharacterized protein YcnI
MKFNTRAGAFLVRLFTTALVVGGLVVSGTAPASAHASVQMYGESAKAGGYGVVFIRVPHGKPGLTTNVVEVQIPEGVASVKPQRIAGWSERVNYAEDGKTATSVTWSGGDLPDSSFQDFGISVKFPATDGATLYFKTVQTLSDGSFASWIEIPGVGVDAHSLSYPAPSLKLATAAGHGHGSDGYADGAQGDMPAHSGEMQVTIKGKTVRVLADTATSNAGKKAVIKVIEGNKSSTVISIKLDSKGDLSRSLPARKSGKGGYTLNTGDKLELTVGGKVVASATI